MSKNNQQSEYKNCKSNKSAFSSKFESDENNVNTNYLISNNEEASANEIHASESNDLINAQNMFSNLNSLQNEDDETNDVRRIFN